MTALIDPRLTVPDMLVADCAEHLASEAQTLARLRVAGLSTDPALLDAAVRAFWFVGPERYDAALTALVVEARAVA